MESSQNVRGEKAILWLSFGAGVAFAVTEFIFSVHTHSQSVLMDAAYDSTELIVIILTLFITPLFHKPLTEKRPYGYSQLESFFIIIKNFMMLSVSLGLSVNSIEVSLSGGHEVDGGLITVFQLILGCVSFVILLIMRHMNRELSSPTVDAEILGWRLDVAYSGGLALAFFGSTFLKKTPLAFLAPYFDQIIAIVIVIVMLPANLKMLWRAIQDVFLFSPEESITERIKELSEPVLEKHKVESVFYDITRTGRRLWVDIYFDARQDLISIRKLRRATDDLQKTISEEFDNCICELLPHIPECDVYYEMEPDEEEEPAEVSAEA